MLTPKKQLVTVQKASTGKDRYGRDNTTPITVKAHVKLNTRTVRSTDGAVLESRLEITLPPEAPVTYSTEISYTHTDGVVYTGKVETIKDITNFAGDRVLERVITLA